MPKQRVSKEDLKGKKFTTILDDEELKVDEYFDPSDFVSPGRGQLFVRHDPLLRVAKEVMGILGRKIEVNQSPSVDNDNCATVTVTYKFGDGDESVFWGDAADCNNSNTRRGFGKYATAMATTRASARALRFALGVEFCSVEEIAEFGDSGGDNEDLDSPIDASQINLIKTKMFGQYMFEMSHVNAILKKQFDTEVEMLEEMTRGQAAAVVQSLHRRKKPVDAKKDKAAPAKKKKTTKRKPKARTRE